MNTNMEYEDILMRNQDLRIENEQLKKEAAFWKFKAECYAKDSWKLAADRDQARIRCCTMEAEERTRAAGFVGLLDRNYFPADIARENGWDCFEEKPKQQRMLTEAYQDKVEWNLRCMHDLWGDKCEEYEQGCGTCEAWRLYEMTGKVTLVDDLNAASAV
jgi:hypothetical protein